MRKHAGGFVFIVLVLLASVVLAVLAPVAPARASYIQGTTAGGGTTNQNIRTIGATFVNGGAALTGSTTSCTVVYFAGTIQQVDLIADQSGSATVDVQTVAFGSYTGPGSASSITAADTPALSSAVKFSDSTLTGWTTGVAANSVFCFVLSSPTTVTYVEAVLKVAAN
jgi:hypothetical protein